MYSDDPTPWTDDAFETCQVDYLEDTRTVNVHCPQGGALSQYAHLVQDDVDIEIYLKGNTFTGSEISLLSINFFTHIDFWVSEPSNSITVINFAGAFNNIADELLIQGDGEIELEYTDGTGLNIMFDV